MNKEELLALGLTEEEAEKVLLEMTELQKTVKERDKQLADLQKAAAGNEELQKQIADLQKQNAEQEKAHQADGGRLKTAESRMLRLRKQVSVRFLQRLQLFRKTGQLAVLLQLHAD